jgi:hypothetical protein
MGLAPHRNGDNAEGQGVRQILYKAWVYQEICKVDLSLGIKKPNPRSGDGACFLIRNGLE